MQRLSSPTRSADSKHKFHGRFLSGPTIHERLCAGRSTGFDYLRIGLAAAVICVHSAVTSYGPSDNTIWHGWYRPPVAAILPMFFALSGFLVTGSLLRAKSMTEFVMLRVLRIVPALLVEVIVVAFVLGPLLTSVPLRDYVTDAKFISYPLNILGDIHYHLPGLFLSNPDPDMVNRQLWTIPSELRCYFVIVVLAMIGFARNSRRMLVILAISLVAFPLVDFMQRRDLWHFDNVPSKALILSFLAGVSLFLGQKQIRLNPYCFTGSMGLAFTLLLFRETAYFACLPIAYCTVYVGLSQIPKTIVVATGDYSYGLYLYGYPIQQTYSYLFPGHRVWWLNIPFTMLFGLAFAALSWHVVEAKVLRWRKRIIPAIESGVDLLGRLPQRGLRPVRQRLYQQHPESR